MHPCLQHIEAVDAVHELVVVLDQRAAVPLQHGVRQAWEAEGLLGLLCRGSDEAHCKLKMAGFALTDGRLESRL